MTLDRNCKQIQLVAYLGKEGRRGWGIRGREIGVMEQAVGPHSRVPDSTFFKVERHMEDSLMMFRELFSTKVELWHSVGDSDV